MATSSNFSEAAYKRSKALDKERRYKENAAKYGVANGGINYQTLSAPTLSGIIDGNSIFEEFKGAIAEQYVLQQFKTIKDLPVFYWSNETSRAEIDFVIQIESSVVPIEVKATKNLQAKSLKNYIEKYKPNLAIRTSLADYKQIENLIDLPLYCIEHID